MWHYIESDLKARNMKSYSSIKIKEKILACILSTPWKYQFFMRKIGDNVAIGANAVVSKSVPNFCTVINANEIRVGQGSLNMIYYGDPSKKPTDCYAESQAYFAIAY